MEFLATAVLLGFGAYALERRLKKIEQRLNALDNYGLATRQSDPEGAAHFLDKMAQFQDEEKKPD
jgi:hypothetical protein